MQAPDKIESRNCLHCSTALRKNQEIFCCIGCEFVYKSINSLGLSNFYKMRFQSEALSANDVHPEKNYEYLNDPEIQGKIVKQVSEQILQVKFYLPTIHCAACVWILERLPQAIEGIIKTRVIYSEALITINFDSTRISLIELAKILNSIGYPPVPAEDSIIEEKNKKDEKRMLIRIGIAAVATANVMMLADSLFESFFSGMDNNFRILFTYASAILTLPVVTYCAMPFYRMALGSLIVGVIHLDLPISVAIITSYLSDLITIINGGNRVYFDSISCLVFLLLFARYIQKKAVFRSRASIATSWDLFPAHVKVKSGNEFVSKPLRDVKTGDLILVAPGERIPSDGLVVEGVSSVDSSFINGESKPNLVENKSFVLAGTLNIENDLLIEILETGKQTRLGKIIEQVKSDQSNRNKIEQEIDKISRYFVIIVLGVAVTTFLIWNFIDPNQALRNAIAVLVITCPCALGLAIPAAVTVALSQAQQNKIFIKQSEALQTLYQGKHFYFDKTGTLTSGILTVEKIVGDTLLAPHAARLAEFTNFHPVSAAISSYSDNKPEDKFTSKAHVAGRGITASLEGRQIHFGSYKWIKELDINISDSLMEDINLALSAGSSLSFFAVNNNVELVFILSDQITPEAKQIISELQNSGKSVYILSGDSRLVVENIAKKLGIPSQHVYGDLYPEQKAQIIQDNKEITIMVGDGINDALAMKAADLGIGLRGGIEATLESADIFISRFGLIGFQIAYSGAIKTHQVIVQNLGFSILYNVIGGTAAVFGFVSPIVAAIMMPLSSLTVIVSSICTKYFKQNFR